MSDQPNILFITADQLRQAETVGDADLLASDAFARGPLDREALRKQPVGGMGWRWF
jgi:hypothetical protein